MHMARLDITFQDEIAKKLAKNKECFMIEGYKETYYEKKLNTEREKVGLSEYKYKDKKT